MAKTAGNKYFEGIGRRKTSTARVRVFNDKGTNIINGKQVEEFITLRRNIPLALRPLVVTSNIEKLYFTANVNGGGMTSQAEAISLGISRALVKMHPELRETLKVEDLLTRDSRMVERKKYHHRKARKKPQFSKR